MTMFTNILDTFMVDKQNTHNLGTGVLGSDVLG